MAWYLRLHKLGPYSGLSEKGLSARGGLSLLQADPDFIDDAEYIAHGRVASHGLAVTGASNHKDLDMLETHRVEQEAALLSKQVQHLANSCIKEGILSPADVQALSIGGPWTSPALAPLQPLSPEELKALAAEPHAKHATGAVEEEEAQLENSRALRMQTLAARAGTRGKAQQGRLGGVRRRGSGEVLEDHVIIAAAHDQTEGADEDMRSLYLRAVGLGPAAFRKTIDHRRNIAIMREKQREVAKAMEIRTFQGAMLLSPELRELVNCGAGAELVWRSDLGGTELCQVLSALSDHQQQKQLSGLRADLRDVPQVRQALSHSLLPDCPFTVKVPTLADFQHLMHHMAVINEDMDLGNHLTFCVPSTSAPPGQHAAAKTKSARFPVCVEIYQPSCDMLSGPAFRPLAWPTALTLQSLVQRVVAMAQEKQRTQPLLVHAADEATWLEVLGLLTSLHINNHFQWHDGVMKAFVMHTIPVLKGGKFDMVTAGKARKGAASSSSTSGDQSFQLRLAPELYYPSDLFRLVAYQQLLESRSAHNP